VICHQKLSCNPDVAGSGCRLEGSAPASKLAGDPGWGGHSPATSSATTKFSAEGEGGSMFRLEQGFE
jgi:hypothetical protein